MVRRGDYIAPVGALLRRKVVLQDLVLYIYKCLHCTNPYVLIRLQKYTLFPTRQNFCFCGGGQALSYNNLGGVALRMIQYHFIMAKKKGTVALQDTQALEMPNWHLKTANIETLIYVVRNCQVMLDSDLAQLYGVETSYLNRQVKRNIGRFPEDFMFELSSEELSDLRCQNGTSSWGGSRYLPHAFTENGIAMLSGILRSDTAIEVNIRIMRAFSSMRHFLATNAHVFQRLASLEMHQLETDRRIDQVFQRLDSGSQPQQGIFFDGQVFDAYRFASDLIRKAQKRIALIDNYVDDTVLALLDKRAPGVEAVIYTSHPSRQFRTDLQRHNAQYPDIKIMEFSKSHDRFLLIDSEVYLIGASMKDLGRKWFAFTLLNSVSASELEGRIDSLSTLLPG